MLISLALLGSAVAQDAPDDAVFEPVPELRDYVGVSTKVTQPAIETPAAVSVISREEITRRGYSSVADALRSVPGFYVTYDLVNYNVAVRGALGGARSGGRLLKVMVDGVPVPFVQTESYFLGPEFIPMSSVERIEVMKGPVSSLYGAGAYAGAINIVTRQAIYDGKPAASVEIRGFGGVGVGAPYVEGGDPPKNQLYGGDATFTFRSRDTSLTAGVNYQAEDRSALAVDPESVFFDPEAPLSQNDRAAPRSFFVRMVQRVGPGRLSIMGLGQVSDRSAEFSDLVQLSHDTRQNLSNWKAAAGYEYPFGANGTLQVRAAVANGTVGGTDRFRLSAGANNVIKRKLSSLQETGSVEARFDFGESSFLMFGIDGMVDQENLPRYTFVFDDPDAEPLDPYGGEQATLANGGAFVQGLAKTGPVTLTGGARLDVHSVYGAQGSGRVALLYNPTPRFAVKAIGGNSFKAASPEQLYVTPLTEGDVAGDDSIKPQYLFGGELAFEAYPTETVQIGLSGFLNRYSNTLGYVLEANQLIPKAYDANNAGGEFSLRVHQPVVDGIWAGGQASVSLQQTVTEVVQQEVLVEKSFPDNEAAPQAMGYGRLDVGIDPAYLNLALEGWYIGKRVPSQSNLFEAGGATMTSPVYSLDPYATFDLTVSSTPISLSGTNTIRLIAKVQNALDQRFSEIGFNGVDVPAQGRRMLLRADLSL